jgi:hypothetical protein
MNMQSLSIFQDWGIIFGVVWGNNNTTPACYEMSHRASDVLAQDRNQNWNLLTAAIKVPFP